MAEKREERTFSARADECMRRYAVLMPADVRQLIADMCREIDNLKGEKK